MVSSLRMLVGDDYHQRDVTDRIVSRWVNGQIVAKYSFGASGDSADVTLDAAGIMALEVTMGLMSDRGRCLVVGRTGCYHVWERFRVDRRLDMARRSKVSVVVAVVLLSGGCGFPWLSSPTIEESIWVGFDAGEFVLIALCDDCVRADARAVVTLVRDDMSAVDFELQPSHTCVWRDGRLKLEMVRANDFALLEVRVRAEGVVASVVIHQVEAEGNLVNPLEAERTIDSFSCAR